MTLVLNPSVAVAVTVHVFGPEELDSEGQTFRPIIGVEPGARLDVQRECLALHPALEAFIVTPAEPVHDCGPNGIRLLAPTIEDLQAAAPPSGAPWDVWIEVAEEPAP